MGLWESSNWLRRERRWRKFSLYEIHFQNFPADMLLMQLIETIPISRSELHDLLTKPSLSRTPLQVHGNKINKSESLSKQALVDQLDLESITNRGLLLHDLMQGVYKH